MQLSVMFLIMLAAAPHAMAEAQGWMTNTLSVAVNKKLGIRFCHESRYAKSTYHGGPFLDALQGGLAYRLPASAYLGILYRRENIQVGSLLADENRIGFEGGWTPALFAGFRVDSRIRLEARYFEQSYIQDQLRLRAKIGISYRTRFGKFNVAPFIATEVFGDDRLDWNDYPNRNRFYLGMQFPFSDNLGITVNYVREDTKGRPVVNALNTGINLKL